MNKLELVEKHLEEIKRIIRNCSASNIGIEFRTDIYEIADANGIQYCKTCNTQLYNTIVRIYRKYVAYIENKKAKKTVKNGDQTNNQEESRETKKGKGRRSKQQ